MKQSLLAILMATRKKPEIRQGYILDTTRRSELCQIYTCGVTDYAVRKHTICLHRNQSLDPLGFTMAADVHGFAVGEFGLHIFGWT